MKNLTIDQATELFGTHPNTNEFHVTTDGQAFFEVQDAESHGQRLKDRAVELITREGFEAVAGQVACIKHIVTEEDLANNTDLVEAGVKVGDEIELPVKDEAEAPIELTFNELKAKYVLLAGKGVAPGTTKEKLIADIAQLEGAGK